MTHDGPFHNHNLDEMYFVDFHPFVAYTQDDTMKSCLLTFLAEVKHSRWRCFSPET